MTCTADYAVTDDDITAGRVLNTATVAGTPPNGAAAITPAVSNQVVVPIPPPTGAPPTTTTTTTTTSPPTGQLPATGTDIATTLRIVLIATLLGTALVAISRRRNGTIH